MAMPKTRPVHDAPMFIKSVASTAYEPGDLLYLTSDGAVAPASSQVDQLSEALNQTELAENFVGLCCTTKLATDSGTDPVGVLTEIEAEYPCTAATYAVGDLLGGCEAASGTALEDQKVKAATDYDRAIGVCSQAATSSDTKVWMRIFSRFANMKPATGPAWEAQTIDMADAAVTLTKTVGSPAGTYLSGNLLLVDPNSGGVSENLLLPPEADMADQLLIIKCTGGEHIAVQNDAGGAVCTVEDAEAAILHCDGTTWNKIQFVETT
jgi:hypothetical protein